ncbi:hypothetical protein MMC20_007278 [Loxospora ochrophaea]|nr:hypothetical protein [Loxospora ochrophaea]
MKQRLTPLRTLDALLLLLLLLLLLRPLLNIDPARPTRSSTITSPERAVFERIFAEIAQPHTKRRAPTDGQLFNDREEDVLDELDPGEVDLEAIFDEAILQSRVEAQTPDSHDKSQERRLIDISPYPPSLREAAEIENRKIEAQNAFIRRKARSLPPHDPPTGKAMKTQSLKDKIEATVTRNLRIASALLDHAETASDLWDVLEQRAFEPMKQLSKAMQQKEKRKAKREEAATVRMDEKRKTTNDPTDGVEASEAAFATLPSTEQSSINPFTYETIEKNYSKHCARALHFFRSRFPTSHFAMRVLPTVKRLGPISYALGASTQLYNEHLYLKWIFYKDLHGINEIVLEMLNHGIEPDRVTLLIMADIARKRRRALKGVDGEVAKAWWKIQESSGAVSGILTARKRVKASYHERLRRNVQEAMTWAETEDDNEGGNDGGSTGGNDADPDSIVLTGRG